RELSACVPPCRAEDRKALATTASPAAKARNGTRKTAVQAIQNRQLRLPFLCPAHAVGGVATAHGCGAHLPARSRDPGRATPRQPTPPVRLPALQLTRTMRA
ncbi:hypothetical protein RZS08_23215, partial [Arthrospira platensis SPKY1]|nr:hypothetical protein [Arthrospira platensis SPKY1]